MNKSSTGEILAETIDMLTSGKFEVKTFTQGEAQVHQIMVDRSEYGKICGSKGKMIRAIKYIWEVCISRNEEVPIRVNLKEPIDGYSKGRSAEVPSELFDLNDFLELIEDIMDLVGQIEVEIDDSETRQSLEWDARNKIYKLKIYVEDPPKYLKSEFEEACQVLFFAMAKANGGLVDIIFDG